MSYVSFAVPHVRAGTQAPQARASDGGGGGGGGERGWPCQRQSRGASLGLHGDGLLELGLRDGGLLVGEGQREQPLVYAARGLRLAQLDVHVAHGEQVAALQRAERGRLEEAAQRRARVAARIELQTLAVDEVGLLRRLDRVHRRRRREALADAQHERAVEVEGRL